MLDGEAPETAALREAREETGLTQLRVVRFLGEVRRDMSDRGRDEIHHRFIYHLIMRWPAAGAMATLRARSLGRQRAATWVPLPDGVPELIAGHGDMLSLA